MFKKATFITAVVLLGAGIAQADDFKGALCTTDGCTAIPPAIAAAVVLEGIFQKDIEQNIAAAKGESGVLAQVIRATIGVSLDDIGRYGLAGGPNSEINKIGRFFADLFHW